MNVARSILYTGKEQKMKSRKEMNPEFMWDFTHIFPTREAFEAAFAECDNSIATLGELRGHLGDSPETLLKALDTIYAVEEKFERVYSYASLHKEADNSDPEYQEMAARAMGLYVKLSAAISFLDPEIISIGSEKLEKWIASTPALGTYAFMMRDLMRMQDHVLDHAREELLAELGEAAQAPNDCYDMLTNVDMDFPAVKMSDGSESPLTNGNFGVYRENTDRAVRVDAFEKFFGTYKKYINTFAATYGGSVKYDCFNAKVRGYSSACEAALFANNVPVSVYDSLVGAIHDALPSMRRYLDIRRKAMGAEKIDMFDLYVPIVEGVDIPMPYSDAKTLVKEALKPFGKRYGELLDLAYSEHWIDVYENKGKSSGAFSAGVYGVHPYVMLNYTDTLDDAFTLAHELGHAMHSFFSSETQDYPNHDYRIMVAEVASTVNEVMLTKYLLAHETDPGRRAYVLNHFLEGFRTTVFRQTLFAEFERRSHDMYAAGTPLTAKSLSDAYYDLISTYYDGAEINDIMRYEWSYIPHFYRAFYVYQYATGFCSAVAIAGRIAAGGDPAGYLKFLTLGGSDYPIEELKVAGVDLTKPDTVAAAMKVFDEAITEFDEMLGSLKK